MKQKGFTLIELLVVIAIIALLASVLVASLARARLKSREAKRKADASQIQKALELYQLTNNRYPNNGLCTGLTGCDIQQIATGYVTPAFASSLPNDPKTAGAGYPNNYAIAFDPNFTGYALFIPFSLDGNSLVSCVLRQNHTAAVFGSAPTCSYQN